MTAQHGEYIDFDLEATPLQIKTDSAVGSEDQVVVFFFSSHGGRAGGILLYFGPTLQYYIWHCQQGIYSNFLAPLPTATEKEWRVTVTRTSSVRVVIQCQDVEVANVVLSDSTCSEEDWRETWSNDVEKIFFTDTDTATDLYLEPVTPGRLIVLTWETGYRKTEPDTNTQELHWTCVLLTSTEQTV